MRTLMAFMLVAVALSGCVIEEPELQPEQPGGPTSSEICAGSPDPYCAWSNLRGFDKPVILQWTPDGERLLIGEQRGVIFYVDKDGESGTFGDLRNLVRDTGSEQGLLGLALHPDFAVNGVIILHYTGTNGESVLARFHSTADAISPDSAEILLTVDQPFENHNGGHIEYGPDGYLYMGLGDGGSAGDPQGNGQNPHTLLGSILRLDIGIAGNYQIPSDNPYADGLDGAPEVWIYGLRNPWKFSVGETHIWIGDVGQNQWEEINRVALTDGGANLGWNLWEGNHQYPSGVEGSAPGFVFPIEEFSHEGGNCSVTGGVFDGHTFYYGDFCSGRIWTIWDNGGPDPAELWADTNLNVAAFGMTPNGIVYVADHGGSIHPLGDFR